MIHTVNQHMEILGIQDNATSTAKDHDLFCRLSIVSHYNSLLRIVIRSMLAITGLASTTSILHYINNEHSFSLLGAGTIPWEHGALLCLQSLLLPLTLELDQTLLGHFLL